jgi:hypothetical protein
VPDILWWEAVQALRVSDTTLPQEETELGYGKKNTLVFKEGH